MIHVHIPIPHNRWNHAASAFLDGELTPSARLRFERHLDSCARCQQELSALRAAREGLRALPPLAAPRSFAVTPAMLQAAPARRSRPFALHLSQGVAALAALAFATIVAIDVTHGGGPATTRTAAPVESAQTAHASVAPSAPQPLGVAPATGRGASDQSSGAQPAPKLAPAASPTPGGSQNNAAPATAFNSHPNAGVSAGQWYRPAEIALAVVALASAAIAILLALKRGWRFRP